MKAIQRVTGQVLKVVVLICTIIIFIIVAFLIRTFSKDSFQYKTYINGVECSFLNLDSTSKKLEQSMNNAEIKLLFAEDKEYTCIGSFFDIKVENQDELKKIMYSQKGEENKEYNIENLYSVNEEKVKEYLSSLSIFHENNIKKPENAYLEFNDKNELVVKPEKYGNELNLNTAYKYMIKSLKAGKTVIDFKDITNIVPSILSTNEKLNSEKDYINSILSSTIEYKLNDGSTYVLDAKKMKEWIYRDDDGYYNIDIDGNVPKFVDKLNEKCSYTLTSTEFNATGLGKIKVPFGRRTYADLDKEKEIKRIKEQLTKGEKITFDPIYNPLPDYLNISTYVEIDLSRQKVWMYVNGKQIVNTSCVTGNVAGGYATPAGIYYLTYKTTDTYLEGYNGDGSKYSSHVNFWMPFNGGIGLHDALWRSNFGGNIYMTNGSHGCVNLPYAAAKTIYNNINTAIPIILYNS